MTSKKAKNHHHHHHGKRFPVLRHAGGIITMVAAAAAIHVLPAPELEAAAGELLSTPRFLVDVRVDLSCGGAGRERGSFHCQGLAIAFTQAAAAANGNAATQLAWLRLIPLTWCMDGPVSRPVECQLSPKSMWGHGRLRRSSVA